MTWFLSGALAYAATLAGIIALRRTRQGQHAQYPPLDADLAAWDDLVRRLEGPTTWCATCAHPTADDRLWCSAECQILWMEEA